MIRGTVRLKPVVFTAPRILTIAGRNRPRKPARDQLAWQLQCLRVEVLCRKRELRRVESQVVKDIRLGRIEDAKSASNHGVLGQ